MTPVHIESDTPRFGEHHRYVAAQALGQLFLVALSRYVRGQNGEHTSFPFDGCVYLGCVYLRDRRRRSNRCEPDAAELLPALLRDLIRTPGRVEDPADIEVFKDPLPDQLVSHLVFDNGR